jgi:DNA-binding PadR family transcriptional regulator
MTSPPRMTMATHAVLKVLLEDATQPRYGFDVAKEAGIATGSLYPILARLERLGWLASHWEEQDPTSPSRPRRRYYQLTPTGVIEASKAIEVSLRRIAPTRWRPAEGIA